MNKRLLIGMFIALMAMVPSSGYAFQTIDAPHFNVDSNGGSEDCTYCHFANYQPSDCIRCHANNNAPYGDSTAPLVSTHQNLDCQACHNPHVSLQATGIAGTYSGVSANTPSAGLTTLSGVTPTPEVSWVEKTGPGRGMILWIANGTNDPDNPEPASFEVEAVDAGAGTVTVKGNVSLASGNFDLRRGQLIAKKVTKTAASSYRQGDLPVQFPSQGSSSIFIDTQNGANPTGVCQVCHTATAYWKNDGSATTHNANLPCTQCHQHSSGFMVTGCTACHPGPGPDGPPTIMGEMALPPTGSQTPGMHTIHATTSGYNFPCGTCHYGTGMDRINAPDNVVKGDGIQIGFSWGKFMGYLASYNGQASVTVPYVGTNKTTVTNTGAINNGSMTCSNVYCHSDGTAVRRNCATSTLNTSLAWDGSSADPQGDTVKCNNCHGFNNGMANTMTSGKHLTHVKNLSMPCFYCHADTVQNNGSGVSVLSNKTNHVNAVYDVKGGGDWYGTPIIMDKNIASGTGAWNATTKNCTVICHNYSRNWTANDAGACPDPCVGVVNVDPIIKPYSSPVSVSEAFVYANDPNTLHYKIRAYDPDSVDPVVAQCRGGGHAGGGAFIRTNVGGNQCQNFTSLALSNTTHKEIELSCRFSDAKLSTSKNMCFNFAMADNDPASYNLLAGYNWVVPDNAPNDGLAKPASTVCMDPTVTPLNVVDNPMNNIVPQVTRTVSVSGKTVSVSFNVKDADQVDAGKKAYYNGLYPTKTGGHSADTNHYVQIIWSNEGLTVENKNPTNVNALQLTTTGGTKTYSFNYDNLSGTIGTNDGAAVTTRQGPKAPGTAKLAGNAWIRGYICDNHILGVENNMGKHCYDTGWFNVVLQ